MGKIHLWPEKVVELEGRAVSGFTLESTNGERQKYWYKLPSEYRPALVSQESGNCDAYLAAVIMHAMKQAADLVIHGQVSETLLGNIDEFMTIWNCWLPDSYQRVEVMAESLDDPSPCGTGEAVLTFSGGVDSSYSAWRYRNGPQGRLRQPLTSGLMLHGFDIPLRQTETFERAFYKAKIMLESLGMLAIPMETNLKWLGDFDDSHGAFLASCLMLVRGRFDTGLIASSVPYSHMSTQSGLPYGSNYLTDELLSSRAFRILNDSSGPTRIQKIAEIAQWPEALQHLRVCLREGGAAELRDENCCQCLKCARNMLAFRALGLEQPACFPYRLKDSSILQLRYKSHYRIKYFERVLALAAQNNLSASWIWALRTSVWLNQVIKLLSMMPIINRYRKPKRYG